MAFLLSWRNSLLFRPNFISGNPRMFQVSKIQMETFLSESFTTQVRRVSWPLHLKVVLHFQHRHFSVAAQLLWERQNESAKLLKLWKPSRIFPGDRMSHISSCVLTHLEASHREKSSFSKKNEDSTQKVAAQSIQIIQASGGRAGALVPI